MVLNPHGSDETGRDRIFFFLPLEVLNPHGSDETNFILYIV